MNFVLKELLTILFSAIFIYLLGAFMQGHVDITQWTNAARVCAVSWFIVVLIILTTINFYYEEND